MFASFAAGTLIVLGAVIAILGFVPAASLPVIVVGLGSVAVGGVIGLFDRRRPA